MKEAMKTDDYIQKLEESLRFYSNPGKTEREAWVVGCFLEIIGVPCSASDIKTGFEEPVDIGFMDGRFQIKELLDKGRKRTDEVKASLQRARQTEAEEIVPISSFEPEFLIPRQLVKRLEPEMEEKVKDYSRCSSTTTDLLFYANLRDVFVEDKSCERLEIELSPALRAWRSVSITSGEMAVVLFASADAPAFMKAINGKVYFRAR